MTTPTGNTEATTVLYRPVGPDELKLIVESGFRVFPPRLPEQPISYPVLNEEYAAQMARDWNAKDAKKKAGYVTQFRVCSAFLSPYEVKRVGANIHQEYWIPAGAPEEFNRNIAGPIQVIAEFRMDDAKI